MNSPFNTKGLALFCLFLGISLTVPAQDGYKYIQKAEKLIGKGQFQRARVHLAEAREQDYGFCGNAWVEAFNGIHFNEARILIAKEKYEVALDSLQEISYGFDDTEPYDSLKVACLVGLFGKEKAKAYVDEAVERNVLMGWFEPDMDPPIQVRIPGRKIELEVGRFGGSYAMILHKIYQAETRTEKGKHFWELVRQQPFYQLLES